MTQSWLCCSKLVIMERQEIMLNAQKQLWKLLNVSNHVLCKSCPTRLDKKICGLRWVITLFERGGGWRGAAIKRVY